jgi:hypothetical protein
VELGSVFRNRLIIAMSEVNAPPNGRRFYFCGEGQWRNCMHGVDASRQIGGICRLIH